MTASLMAACGGEAGEWTPWPPQEQVARPEHPRPDFRRRTFVNLNTAWEFAFDPDDVGIEQAWFGRDDVWTERIQVPYAWEAPLSGLVPPHEGPYSVGETMLNPTYRGVAWYRLRFPEPLPERAGMDWHLVFGAVDFAASVWINGQPAGEHTGGYAPFSIDLGGYGPPGEPPDIVVRVEDYTELNDLAQPVGKQGGVWYTRTSGIWQTVYLEQRPAVHLTGLHLVPDPDHGQLRVTPELNVAEPAGLSLRALLNGEPVGKTHADLNGDPGQEVVLDLSRVARWDVDAPVLYELIATVTGPDGVPDIVQTTFGLVEVGTEWLPGRSPQEIDDPAAQAKAIWVNGRPRYLRCVLDQSYHPDGVLTAPSAEAILDDLKLAKELGFNCIRLHIKVDEPIKLHLADALGMFVVYDIPSLDVGSDNGAGFAGRAHFEQVLRRAIRRDRNHPSVIAWVVFNENWGLMEQGSLLDPVPLADSPEIQTWVAEMVGLARDLDPNRPVEDNSAGGIVGRYEHLDTDLNSFHYYGQDPAAFRTHLAEQAAETFPGSPANFVGGAAQDGSPWLTSEFASFSVVGDDDAGQFCDLFWMFNELRRTDRLVGYVLTQLTDVEFETNGLVTYDRQPKPDLCARHGVGLQDLTGADFVGFDWLPGHAVDAGEAVEVPLFVSTWASPQPETLSVSLAWADGDSGAMGSLESVPYETTGLVLQVPAPPPSEATELIVELLDGQGVRRAANRLPIEVN